MVTSDSKKEEYLQDAIGTLRSKHAQRFMIYLSDAKNILYAKLLLDISWDAQTSAIQNVMMEVKNNASYNFD